MVFVVYFTKYFTLQAWTNDVAGGLNRPLSSYLASAELLGHILFLIERLEGKGGLTEKGIV